jgi:hypothetical protein
MRLIVLVAVLCLLGLRQAYKIHRVKCGVTIDDSRYFSFESLNM